MLTALTCLNEWTVSEKKLRSNSLPQKVSYQGGHHMGLD